MLQVGRDGAHLLRLHHHHVGQCARQHGLGLRGDDLLANDVAHRAVRSSGRGVDIGLEFCLVIGELALDRGLVEILHPALLCIHRGAALGGCEQGIGIQRHGGLEVHARAVAVLFVAGVQRSPGVQVGIGVGVLPGGQVPATVLGTPAGGPVHIGVDPDVLHADGGDAPAAGDAHGSDAALVEDLQRGFGLGGATHPVLHLVGGNVHGAELVAGRDVGRAQQRDQETCSIRGVATFLVQGVLGALDGAGRGGVFDAALHPVVDGDGVVGQFQGLGADGRGELDFVGLRQVGQRGGLGGYWWDVELQRADVAGRAVGLGQVDFLVGVEVLKPGGLGFSRWPGAGLGGGPWQGFGFA